jgi:regulator of RNase E activity RraA
MDAMDTDSTDTTDTTDSTATTDAFADLPTTTLADVLGRGFVMDIGIRSLTGTSGRLAGPAFTVRCPGTT